MPEKFQAFITQHKGILIGGVIGIGVFLIIKLRSGSQQKGASANLDTIHQDLQQIDTDLQVQSSYVSTAGAYNPFAGPGSFPGNQPPSPTAATADDDRAVMNLINSKHIATSEAQEESQLKQILAKLNGTKPPAKKGSTTGVGSAVLEFVPDWMPQLNGRLLDFWHDSNAYINQYAYGLPGDYNEDAGQ